MSTMFAAQTLPTAARPALRSAARRASSVRAAAAPAKTNTVVDAAIANPDFSVLVEAVVKVRGGRVMSCGGLLSRALPPLSPPPALALLFPFACLPWGGRARVVARKRSGWGRGANRRCASLPPAPPSLLSRPPSGLGTPVIASCRAVP